MKLLIKAHIYILYSTYNFKSSIFSIFHSFIIHCRQPPTEGPQHVLMLVVGTRVPAENTPKHRENMQTRQRPHPAQEPDSGTFLL